MEVWGHTGLKDWELCSRKSHLPSMFSTASCTPAFRKSASCLPCSLEHQTLHLTAYRPPPVGCLSHRCQAQAEPRDLRLLPPCFWSIPPHLRVGQHHWPPLRLLFPHPSFQLLTNPLHFLLESSLQTSPSSPSLPPPPSGVTSPPWNI